MMLHLLMLLLLKFWRRLQNRRLCLLADLLLKHLQEGRLLVLIATGLEYWSGACPRLMLTALENDSRAR